MKSFFFFLIFFVSLLMLSSLYPCKNFTSQLRSGDVEGVIQEMPLEGKVQQLFFSFFYGKELGKEVLPVGNIIYYSWANELLDVEQVRKLSNEVQSAMLQERGLPALIAVDQEGGVVSRLQGQFTVFPGNRALGATGDPELARKAGKALAEELRAVGINLNFAPVVDVNDNPDNPVIGVRSFGDTVEKVIPFGRAMVQGMHEGTSFVTLKHFPGHGNTYVDSHLGLPVLNKSSVQLMEKELRPFIELQENADCIMSAHILIPQVDRFNPASLSEKFLQKLLREQIGYRGVIVSDSLVMNGVAPHQESLEDASRSVSEAAIKAFQAGSDCLILGRLEWAHFPGAMEPEVNQRFVRQVIDAFYQAVREGRISEARIDESLRRIFLLKRKLLLQERAPSPNFKEHQALADEIARKALTLLSGEALFAKMDTHLSGRRVFVIAPEPLSKSFEVIKRQYPSLSFVFVSPKEYLLKKDSHIQEAKQADLTLFFSWNGHVHKELRELLLEVSASLPEGKLVVIGLRNPEEVFLPKHPVFATYSSTPSSLKAIFYLLDTR